MEEAVAQELKQAELMTKDVLRELDILQYMPNSTLVFDAKRKQVESHFEWLLDVIERKRNEALEAIRASEEEAKLASRMRADGLRFREERLRRLREGIFGQILAMRKGLDEDMEKFELRTKRYEVQWKAKKAEFDKKMKEVELRAANCGLKEKELSDEKMAVERLSAELSEKEKEIREEKMAVERRAAEYDLKDKEMCKEKMAIERLSLELSQKDKKMREVKMEIEKRPVNLSKKEEELCEAKMAVERLSAELSRKEKEMSAMKCAVDDLTARIQVEDERRNAACQKLSDEVTSLTQQLELKNQLPRREEQLSTIHNFLHILTSAGVINICSPIKHSDLTGEDLLMLVKGHINDQESAISNVSQVLLKAKDEAPRIVAEALKISYLRESEEQNSQSCYRTCRILLLEQLGQICPQAKPQSREEALKVAVEWSTRVRSCAEKSVELPRFLQILSMYDIGSEFSDKLLVPMLYRVAVHQGKADFCFTLGFTDRIAGYINTMIINGQRLKALEYINAFKLISDFPIAKIVRGHLKHLKNKSKDMLRWGPDGKAMEARILNFQIQTLKELIKRIKDLKLQSEYPIKILEERVTNLEKAKYFKKRPAPCFNHGSDPGPVRKKARKLSGTANPTEVASNAFPKTGSRDLVCPDPSNDPEPLRMNSLFPGTAISARVAPDASNAYPENVFRDAVCSSLSHNSEQSRKNECMSTGTTKSAEVVPNASSAHPKNLSRDVVRPSTNPEPMRKNECMVLGTAKSAEVVPNASSAHPENISRDFVRCNPIGNPGLLRKNECTVSRITKSEKVASNAPNAIPETGSRDVLGSNLISDTEPLQKIGFQLPGTAESMEVSPDRSNIYPEIGSSDQLYTGPISELEPMEKMGCQLPGNAKSTPNTSNMYPEKGSRDALRSGLSSVPERLKKKECKLPRTVKSKESAPKQAINAFQEYGSRNPIPFQNQIPPVSPHIRTSPSPSWYEPHVPPQQYHPRPMFGRYPNPQVPSWHYPAPHGPPLFPYRP